MKSTFRTALPWLIIVAAAIAASVLRYGFIEPSDAAHACDGQTGPWWCGLRNLIVQGFLTYTYGYLAIVAALVALFVRSTWLAVLTASLGVLALQLYCYEGGALALLVGTLRLVRVQYDAVVTPLAGAAPRTTH